VKFISSVFAVITILLFVSNSRAEVSSLHISSRLDPNAIIITQVDVVFVYTQKLVDEFPATKTDWYSSQRQFIAEAGTDIDLVSIFIPQGFDSETASLPTRRNEALKVFVFAQHDDSIAPPIDITELGNVLVEIDAFGILVSSRT
tara:strand:- start:174 stop:608 length:435 start_codon:yes stop_codon:yes gene_type:complete